MYIFQSVFNLYSYSYIIVFVSEAGIGIQKSESRNQKPETEAWKVETLVIVLYALTRLGRWTTLVKSPRTSSSLRIFGMAHT